MIENKDYFGKELNVGDEVAFIERGYRNFYTGKIIKLSKEKCIIEYSIELTQHVMDENGLYIKNENGNYIQTKQNIIRNTSRFKRDVIKK